MNEGSMRRFLPLLMVLGWAVAASPGSADPDFPMTPGLVPQVDFWKRIYSEVDGDHGLLHDSRDLRVVYEVTSAPRDLSRRGRERRVKARREHFKAIVRRLATGKRSGLSTEEKRVLALFPKGVTNATLREASRRIRFQRGQADKFREGLIRQGRWEGYMRQVFRDRRLPEALVALPHVESSFNPKARSHVGASGLWQFTRSTGRLYMRVDHVVDERNDPYLATVAAARLLSSNHQRLETWPLALTAYNHGPAGMARAVRKLGTRDIETIIDKYKSRTFGFASRNFYCEFLAALEVQEQATLHFGELLRDPPARPEIVVMKHFVRASDLAALYGVGTDALREANPALASPVWTGQKYVPKGYPLRVPRDPMRATPEAVLASLDAGKRHAKQLPDRNYRVRRGDSLSRIASRFGVRESELVALNGLRSRHRIRAGQVLKLPVRGGTRYVAATPSTPTQRPADGRYRVRRGDTLSAIGRRFGVSERALMAENGLANRNRIHVGQVLKLPGTGTVTARATAGGTYTIRAGDTLDAVARRFGVTRQSLVSANDLSNAHHLKIGQRLVIPER
jgi:membrane-bound lytic murein transglycosylase D